MRTILVTNDDGIDSIGIQALADALKNLGKVIVVAPDRDKSAVSHSLTMHRPLRLKHFAEDRIAIDGTPTDCVAIALQKIMAKPPVLLVSGINNGPNLGDDISYSGTVAAALEGTMHCIPSMAVSMAAKDGNFAHGAEIATRLAAQVLDQGLPENTLLNVNIPAGETFKGLRVTRQGRSMWRDSIQETTDPWGKTIFWIGGGLPVTDSANDTDLHAIANDYVSVTPIHLDKTSHEGVLILKGDWQLESHFSF
ncbi:MAG: 5'/3'-nucleotidase SurE [Desulfocapsaceae bacterium]|nr:5'/3'-nucleotidase SurE [Desulfocapsaceae bacterium]